MIKQSLASSEADGDQPRLLRGWSRYFALLLVVVGSALLIIGALMPAYTDPIAAERIISGEECQPGVRNSNENSRCDSELWHRSMSALRTNKWRLVDGGGGLLVSGLMVAVFSWCNGRKCRSRSLTPARSLWILILASLCWLIQIPAYQLFYLTEGARDYYPHWADSIAIPIFHQGAVFGLFLPYMAIWLIFVVGARLSAQVFSADRGWPLLNAILTSAVALLLLPIGLYLMIAILGGPMLMVPFLWLTVWLVFYVRAAALTHHRPGSAPQV